MRTRRRQDALVCLVYLALSGWVTGRLWLGLGDRMTDGGKGGNEDIRLFEWYLAYVARAVRHLDNPFFSQLQNAPDGVNLMGNTGMVGLGVPLAPVTWLFGPTVTANLIVCLALFATASAWYFVLSRYLVSSPLAAALGGALCGFSPGMVAHTRGHLNFIAQFLIPLIIALALRLREPGRHPRRAVLLGILVAWQVLIGEEAIFLYCLASGVFVAAYALLRPGEVRELAPRFLTGLGLAAGTALVLLAYPLWLQFFGPQSYQTVPFVSGHGADLASYLATPQLALTGSQSANVDLALNAAEENTFYTIPYVVLACVVAIWLWRSTMVRALVATAGVLVLLSLGKTLEVAGQHTGVPLPWRVLAELPVLDSVLPARFGLVVGTIMAILTALGVDAAVTRLREGEIGAVRAPRLVAGGLLLAVLLPLLPRPVPTIPVGFPVPDFVTSGQWRPYVRDGRSLVPIPFPDVKDASGLRWAAITGVPFAVPGGYFLGPDAEGHGRFGPPPRPTFELLSDVAATGERAEVSDADRANARTDLAYWRADVVVLGRHRYADTLRETLDALLGPSRRVSDVWLWDV
ncbi:glycosyltransferase family protein [Plantactinospora soyae]|uniref:Glycosyl transferase n=1 Tax=Plantactinospora soyae TaxID=1544732 RepID=A0A927R6P0_9ACTN|nr:hypothetical protein [Plantactinospora soyae]MBE1488639.1 hypothetical protein [Plantactinospora soyae]